MAYDLKGVKVAILATDGVERVELEIPRGALDGAGAKTDLLSTHGGEIQAVQHSIGPAGTLTVDRLISETRPDDYDAMFLPGGAVNPDLLRSNKDAVAFVKAFFATTKPVAVLCHAA
jgi:protease I